MYDAATVRENRVKAVNALLTTKEKQGFGTLYSPRQGCYCALGIMADAVGIVPDDTAYCYGEIDEAFGFDENGAESVWRMNDRQELTFPAIAHRLASMWDIAL
jgi:hypothetical protein